MIKHARASIVITKLKEIELMFRKLLIDSSLGSIQSMNVPYSSIDLPVTKITELCKRIIEKEDETLEEIKAKQLINEILETTGKVVKFLRMSRLQFEGVQLNNDDINNQDEENENSEENISEKTTTEEGTDKEDNEDEEF